MATITEPPPAARPATAPDWTAADLLDLLGPIPLWRIRFDPRPGTATEADAMKVYRHEKRLCELVEGLLVEKTMGYQEAYLALLLGTFLNTFVLEHRLGVVLGADGMARLAPGLIRIPDVSFIPWERHPDRKIPREPFVPFAPALAVEVLSPSNTAKEMARKLLDYFATGVRLVWYVDPEARTVEVFTGVGRSTVLREPDTLDGGDVLPGFALPLAQLFAGLGPAAT